MASDSDDTGTSRTTMAASANTNSARSIGMGMSNVSLEPINTNGNNMPQIWKNFKTKFMIYLRAYNLEEETEARKVAIFLHHVGSEALNIFYSFDVDMDTITLVSLMNLYENYFSPKVNVTMERHKLFNRRQNPTEDIDSYATDLKNIGLTCNFDKLRDELVRDIFSWNLNQSNQYIKERILQQAPKTLDEAIGLAKSLELSRIQAKELSSGATTANILSAGKSHVSRPSRSHGKQTYTAPSRSRNASPYRKSSQSATPSRSGFNSPYRNHSSTSGTRSQSRSRFYSPGPSNQQPCNNCGQVHRYRCPAQGVKCRNCQQMNHYSKYCRRQNISAAFVENNSESDDDFLFLGSIKCNNIVENKPWTINLEIHKIPITFLIDSGADANVISYHEFQKLKLPSHLIKKSVFKLSTFTGHVIPTVGQCELDCFYNGSIHKIPFYIAKVQCQNIVGRSTSEKLKLIKRIHKVSFEENQNQMSTDLFLQYKHVFEGIGCVKNFECHLTLQPDVKPSIDACRKIPFKLQEKFAEQLTKLESQGIITRVDEPTAWVNSIVIVSKPDGSLRICLDPRKLNKAILRSHYPFPNIDEVKSDLSGSHFFTKLDAKSGFWMLKLDEESSKLCTFITPLGRYRFLRLPFGINAAPEIFHNEMVKRFGDIKGLKIMMDDFLIYGKTKSEHDSILKQVLERAEQIGLKFNKEKSKMCMSEVKYLGYIFSKDGVSVDPSKVESICKMPSPTTVTELQRFLGMVNFLGPFIQNLSKETTHIRQLLNKNTAWLWTDIHENEFNNLKKIISSAPVLTYFDENKQLTLSVDSSKDAMGAVILHDNNPIAYASASLTRAQQNYSQIEKELLAILFGCTKYHQYIYGNKVLVETDHKPIVNIFNKSLYDIPPRLQRIMLRLQPYDLLVTYKPGKYLYVADTLSRAALPENVLIDIDKDLDLHVNLLVANLSLSPKSLQEIEEATSSCHIINKLKYYIKNGWPKDNKNIEPELKPYFPVKDDIHCTNNIIFMSNRVIIPQSLRRKYLSLLHEGHQGINSCQRLARTSIYWPNINNDIQNYISNCETCLTYRRNNSNESLLPHQFKFLPWNKIAIDFFEFNRTTYLIVVDYFSKYVEIAQCSRITSEVVIVQLKSIFARHGIPSILISDNGPPMNSKAFQDFMNEWNIEHITSSPYQSRSNGLVERTVAIIKNMLKKCLSDNSDPYIALLQYRNTAKDSQFSPAQLLMSRSLRSKLPVLEKNLKPKVSDYNILKKYNDSRVTKMSDYYNRNVKDLKPLEVGTPIMFKKFPDSHWTPGIIDKVCPEPRSYIVKNSDGLYRRNRQYIISRPMFIDPSPDYSPSNSDNVNKQSTTTVLDPTKKYTRSGREIVKPRYY